MGFWTGEELSCSRNARVDDDKFLARESASRQCWAGEAWATQVMSAIGWESSGHSMMYLGTIANVHSGKQRESSGSTRRINWLDLTSR